MKKLILAGVISASLLITSIMPVMADGAVAGTQTTASQQKVEVKKNSKKPVVKKAVKKTKKVAKKAVTRLHKAKKVSKTN